MTPARSGAVPARLGRFQVLAEARAGGTTSVYQVRDPSSSRVLALKTISRRATTERRTIAEQLLARECEVRAALDHPALLPLYECLSVRGAPVLIGPWLPGGTLLQRWQTPPPVGAVLAFAEQVCGGLDALHASGWVHGDLSPVNIMFGGDGRARIIDFGSCVPAGSRRAASIDMGVAGFPARWGVTRLTSAPECWTGDAVDGRTDLYALSVMLYYLLVGAWPFLADDKETLTRLHQETPAPLPSARCPQWGTAMDEVLLRALSKTPAHRFESGAALCSALRAAVAADRGELRAEHELASAGAPVAMAGAPSPDGRSETGGAGAGDAAWRAREVIQDFLAGLPGDERQTFEAAMQALRRQDAALRAEARWQLRRMIAPIAALRAAETLGILDALAGGPRTTAELARLCALREDNVERLCRFLAAERHLADAEGRWALVSPWSALYDRGLEPGEPLRPVGATEAHWARLASWVRTGEPVVAMDADETGQLYAAAVEGLGERSAPQAHAVAASLDQEGLVPDRSAILDVGAGSGVWSLALAARWPEATVTALDRPQVLEVIRARAHAQGLASRLETWEGSWETFAPPEKRFGVILLGKICHLQSAGALSALFQRLRPLLRPEGRLVIIDTIPERLAGATTDVLRYDLALALRTSAGRIHDRAGFERALASANLESTASWNVSQRGGSLDVLVARGVPEPGTGRVNQSRSETH